MKKVISRPTIKTNAKNGRDAKSAAELLNLAKENPWLLFDSSEIRTLFAIGEKAMTRLRKLASREPKSDPWDGDKTRPEEFHRWYWQDRKRLELEHKDL